jgi:arylsulfatase A-like enzyme
MRRAVIVTLDGLRSDFISETETPNLAYFAKHAETFANYRTVFPSCTRVVSACLATGCYPKTHGLQGNSIALIENGRLVAHDVGRPEFIEHKRKVTGTVLSVPTMAERVRDVGGAIIFSNVSPGAAYMHDPDGYGFVYHRAGSFGPTRKPVPDTDQLKVTQDAVGDRSMTERFISEVLVERKPALAVLWLGEPDHTQHHVPLGSREHLEVLRAADANAGLVKAAVDRLRVAGDDVLLIIGSDHGHQTVAGIVDIDAELVSAGLKADIASHDVLAVSNGTSCLIYVDPQNKAVVPRLTTFLNSCKWVGKLIGPDDLGSVGHAAVGGLTFAVSMAASEEPNEFGIPGRSLTAKPAIGKDDRVGCGQHGGLGAFEQAPFLMIDGGGFRSGLVRKSTASVIDIAPSVLTHLRLPTNGLDGVALQQATLRVSSKT